MISAMTKEAIIALASGNYTTVSSILQGILNASERQEGLEDIEGVFGYLKDTGATKMRSSREGHFYYLYATIMGTEHNIFTFGVERWEKFLKALGASLTNMVDGRTVLHILYQSWVCEIEDTSLVAFPLFP